MKTLDTKITISRFTCNREPDYINIEIEDVKSATLLSSTKINMEDFAYAITGHGRTPSTTELYNSYENAGKRIETKWVIMGGVNSLDVKGKEEDEAIKIIDKHFKSIEEYLDDWEIMDYCLSRRQGGEFYQYLIHRYVEE